MKFEEFKQKELEEKKLKELQDQKIKEWEGRFDPKLEVKEDLTSKLDRLEIDDNKKN